MSIGCSPHCVWAERWNRHESVCLVSLIDLTGALDAIKPVEEPKGQSDRHVKDHLADLDFPWLTLVLIFLDRGFGCAGRWTVSCAREFVFPFSSHGWTLPYRLGHKWKS